MLSLRWSLGVAMCEYDPACSKSDDPLATLLWPKERLDSFLQERAEFVVRCPPKKHPLAAVFELPVRGRVLVAPAYQPLRRSLLVDSRPDHELERPNDLHHIHAAAFSVSAYEAHETESGRCRCGTWSYIPSTIEKRVFGVKDGKPYTLANYVATADSQTARRDREASGTGRNPLN